MSIITDFESSVYLFVSVCRSWCQMSSWLWSLLSGFRGLLYTSSYSPVSGSRCVLRCWFNVWLTLVLWIQLRSWCHHKKNFFNWVISSALIFLIVERGKKSHNHITNTSQYFSPVSSHSSSVLLSRLVLCPTWVIFVESLLWITWNGPEEAKICWKELSLYQMRWENYRIGLAQLSISNLSFVHSKSKPVSPCSHWVDVFSS